MNLRHAAALALVGWYLLLLPNSLNAQERAEPNSLNAQERAEPNSKQAIEHKHGNAQRLTPAAQPSLIGRYVAQDTPDQNYSKTLTAKPNGDSEKSRDTTWWSNVLLIIFTAVLAGVGIVQTFILCYTYQIAEVALHRDRPFLFSFSGRVKEQPPAAASEIPEFRYAIGSVSCDIQNFGGGPAIITEIVARLRFGPPPYFATPVSFADCHPLHRGQKVVPPNDRTNFIVMLQDGIQGDDVSKMYDEKSTKRFSCYGIIRYHDVYGKKPYETSFGFHREFGRGADEAELRWTWVDGPEAYNRFT
jgi:hypothetical protein